MCAWTTLLVWRCLAFDSISSMYIYKKKRTERRKKRNVYRPSPRMTVSHYFSYFSLPLFDPSLSLSLLMFLMCFLSSSLVCGAVPWLPGVDSALPARVLFLVVCNLVCCLSDLSLVWSSARSAPCSDGLLVSPCSIEPLAPSSSLGSLILGCCEGEVSRSSPVTR